MTLTRDEKSDMDRGERRAKAHAQRLTKETGVPHRAAEAVYGGLVGVAHWWTVQRKGFIFWRNTDHQYGSVDGVKL